MASAAWSPRVDTTLRDWLKGLRTMREPLPCVEDIDHEEEELRH